MVKESNTILLVMYTSNTPVHIEPNEPTHFNFQLESAKLCHLLSYHSPRIQSFDVDEMIPTREANSCFNELMSSSSDEGLELFLHKLGHFTTEGTTVYQRIARKQFSSFTIKWLHSFTTSFVF
ncbi:uncharacterized protein LOC143146194 [Ptiloglossa arizonensis]|uniref:uncharacterized protein LOC143146194 n=1 Tax=Ptiloglossa arizonensis TaxID=3350558 RepID=UPI003FA17F41